MPYAGQNITVLAQFQKSGVDTAPSPAPTVNIYPPGGPATTGQTATVVDNTNFPGWYSYTINSVVAGSYAIRFLTSDATTDKQNLGAAFVVDGPSNFAALAIDSNGRTQVQYGTSTGQLSAAAGIVDVNVKQWLASAVNALIAGRVDATVGAMQAAVLNAAAFAANAITQAAINAGAIAQDVLNAVASSYNTALSIGAKINAAGGAADPLLNAVPGSYGAGTAGAALGLVNGISSRVLTPGTFTIVNAINILTGELFVIRGIAQTIANGGQIDVPVPGNVAINASPMLNMSKSDGSRYQVTGTPVTLNGINYARYELQVADTQAIMPGPSGNWDAIANATSDGKPIFLRGGPLRVAVFV